MKASTPLIYAALATLLCAGPAWADHWHDDHKHWKKHAKHHGDDDHETTISIMTLRDAFSSRATCG